MEDDPNQENLANIRIRRPNNGGNMRKSLILESPSSLFQKPEIPNTYTHSHANYDRISHNNPKVVLSHGEELPPHMLMMIPKIIPMHTITLKRTFKIMTQGDLMSDQYSRSLL